MTCLVVIVALSGCGGGKRQAVATAPPPPAPVADTSACESETTVWLGRTREELYQDITGDPDGDGIPGLAQAARREFGILSSYPDYLQWVTIEGLLRAAERGPADANHYAQRAVKALCTTAPLPSRTSRGWEHELDNIELMAKAAVDRTTPQICTGLLRAVEEIRRLSATAPSGVDPAVFRSKTLFDVLDGYFASLLDAAPPEIDRHIGVIRAFYAELKAKGLEALFAPGVSEASVAIDRWLLPQCGFPFFGGYEELDARVDALRRRQAAH